MKKKNKIFKILIFVLLPISIVLFFATKLIIKEDILNLKSLLTNEQKTIIKKYLFPYQIISQQEKTILQLKKYELAPLYAELYIKESGNDIEVIKSNLKLSNNKILKKFTFNKGFYYGIYNVNAGTGFVDIYENNLFVLSSRGTLVFRKNLPESEEKFKQIKINTSDFIGSPQFEKSRKYSIKDMLLSKNKIYISYTEEIEEDCWNISVVYGEIRYDNIFLKKLFSPKTCIHSKKNPDKEFNAVQSGGRIINFDENNILLSIGDFRSRYLAQDSKSINGKIIKINIHNGIHEIITMGHRNPQGLYFDKKNNFIIETEHGPYGGDEVNIINVNEIDTKKILNYGWAIASEGEHYPHKNKDIQMKRYEKYPLYKSHSKYGFIEPLKSFVPSIGISEIVKINNNKYVLSSLKDRSLYFFELNDKKNIINLERVEVFERIRDLKFYKNKLYLFLENTASIGIINLN